MRIARIIISMCGRMMDNFMGKFSRHIMLHAVGNTAQQGLQQKQGSGRFCHSYHGANAITEIAAMQTAMETANYRARISLRLTLRIKS